MKKTSGRRNFLKHISVGGTAAALFPTGLLAVSNEKSTVEKESNSNGVNASENDRTVRPYNEAYTGEFLNRLAFPIGGLGAGMFCLEGTGCKGIEKWSQVIGRPCPRLEKIWTKRCR
ncbi:MAG: twin-arginine translocation signal domain-containing protein [Panacibacter sp.]